MLTNYLAPLTTHPLHCAEILKLNCFMAKYQLRCIKKFINAKLTFAEFK